MARAWISWVGSLAHERLGVAKVGQLKSNPAVLMTCPFAKLRRRSMLKLISVPPMTAFRRLTLFSATLPKLPDPMRNAFDAGPNSLGVPLSLPATVSTASSQLMRSNFALAALPVRFMVLQALRAVHAADVAEPLRADAVVAGSHLPRRRPDDLPVVRTCTSRKCPAHPHRHTPAKCCVSESAAGVAHPRCRPPAAGCTRLRQSPRGSNRRCALDEAHENG